MPIFTPRPFARRYLLLERIATGGMAEVFKAKSYGVEGFEKLVVIKKILPHLSRNARFVSMFINEAKIAVGLNHGNIAQVFHLGKYGEDYFIAMEYVHGRDLMQLLKTIRKRGQLLSVPLLLYIAAEAARGLDYAHRKADPLGHPLEIIHRDISPHNLVVSFEGEVKIVDFGIARIATQLMEESKRGRTGGKIAYMSPEQAVGRVMDARSDIFSLGLVSYELLTGVKAYRGQGLTEKLEQVRTVQFEAPRSLRPDLPKEVERILLKMLARDPEERYQTAADLYEDLTELMFSIGGVVAAQEMSLFMRGLFPAEFDRAREISSIQALLGSLERMDRGDRAPDGITLTDAEDADAATMHGPVSYDPDQTLPPSELGPRLIGDCAKRNLLAMLIAPDGLADLSTRFPDDRFLELFADLVDMVQQSVESYGGVADNLVDDRIYALWGLRKSHEDDPERALACALSFEEAIREFNRRHRVSLKISIAIHQGPSLVGKSEGRPNYVALGDTLKLPNLLLHRSAPGEVVVSDIIRQRCESAYKLTPGDTFETLWGKGEAPSFKLVGAKSTIERTSTVSRESTRVERWFPRGQELEVLRDALASIDQRKGLVLGVTGEAGIGKTRLVAEVGRLVRKNEVGWRVGVALHRHRDTPLAVFRSMFASWCRINPHDTGEQVQEKLAPLAELGLDQVDLRFIASLFVPHARKRRSDFDKPEGHEGFFRAMRRVVRGMCLDRPILFCFEDLQWMDPLSLRLVQDVMESTEGLPVLLLVTYRTGYVPPFKCHRWFREIVLESLDQEQAMAMARGILDADELTPALGLELFKRSDGNPLHLEQLVKLLHEGGQLVVKAGKVVKGPRDVAIQVPPTVQGLIESRVDGLSEAGRHLLQLLAVFGRRAPIEIVRDVSRLGNALEPVLHEIQERDLVSLDSKDIVFRNHMTWEVAYNSILSRQRRQHHKQVGETLERWHKGALNRHAEEIFHHFEAAREMVKAARFAGLAGDRYRNEDFLSKAIDFYLEAVALLRTTDDESVDELRLLREMAQFSLKAGHLQWFIGERAAAELTLERGLDFAGELEDDELEARLLLELGRVRGDKGDRFLAQSYLEHALELAESRHADELSCMVLDALGTFYLEAGESDKSVKAFDNGLELAARSESPVAVARLLRGKGTYLIRIGDYDEALKQFNEALALAEATDDTVLCGRILNNIGNTHCHLEAYDHAMEAYRRSGEINMSAGYLRGAVTNHHNIGDLYFRQSRLAKAYSYFVESRNMARDYRWALGEASNLVYMGYIEAVKGDVEAGLDTLRKGILLAEKGGHPEFVAIGNWLQGLFYKKEDPGKSEAALMTALDIARSLKDRKLSEEIRKALEQA